MNDTTPVKVGQEVRFKPFAGLHFYGAVSINDAVIGTVVAVYPEHRWFSVEYGEENQKKTKISFNFDDIGDTVRIVNGQKRKRKSTS